MVLSLLFRPALPGRPAPNKTLARYATSRCASEKELLAARSFLSPRDSDRPCYTGVMIREKSETDSMDDQPVHPRGCTEACEMVVRNRFVKS